MNRQGAASALSEPNAGEHAAGTGGAGLVLRGAADAGELSVSVDLSVAPGETLAVVGPNGAGKSTLLSAIAGLRRLSAGSLRLGGRLLDDRAADVYVPSERRSIGVVFQDLLLFPHLSVLDNVAFGLEARGRARAEARRVAAGWLDRIGLARQGDAKVEHLSGGEAQRVALARALAPSPEALLLDEPLSALDADVRAEIRRELRRHLADFGGPCVIVTHEPLDAALLADRIAVLEAGRITAMGSMTDLVARPRTPWAAELAGTNLLAATAAGVRCQVPGGGAVVVAEAPGDGEVLVAIRPTSVALHLEHPEGSPRNVWQLTVAEIEGYGERIRVRMEGVVPLVAEVTTAAVTDLGIRRGLSVWASVKATEITAYQR